MDYYTEKEWKGAIASLGRLVDIRNFPQIAADILLGKRPVRLGFGIKKSPKALNPEIIGGLYLWTKGPVEILIDHPGMFEVLKTYNKLNSVIGLQLTVTGFGGTMLEPGISIPQRVADGLRRVLETDLIDPESILLRYDPLMKISSPDGKILRNDSVKAFEYVVSKFASLGIKEVSTKFLLFGEKAGQKYFQVYERLKQAGLIPFKPDNQLKIFEKYRDIAKEHGMRLQTCCVRAEQDIQEWKYDGACLSASRLDKVGKRRFGEHWNRISFLKRNARPGCLCNLYWDLSISKGCIRCGSQEAACLYCSASVKNYGAKIKNQLKKEIKEYLSGKKNKDYFHLMDSQAD